jgi:hypothetical protein
MSIARLTVPVGVPLVVEKSSPAPFWSDSYVEASLKYAVKDLKDMSLGKLDPKTIVWAVDGSVVSLPPPGAYTFDVVQVISALGVGWVCVDHLAYT